MTLPSIDDFAAWHNGVNNPLLRRGLLDLQRIAPTQPIRRGYGAIRPLTHSMQSLDTLVFGQDEAFTTTLGSWLDSSETDGYLILRGDTLLLERYDHGLLVDGLHALMSISKSLSGALTGRMIQRGALNPTMRVVDCLPELRHSAYREVSVEQLWHMRSGVAFDADTRNPHSDVTRLAQAIGWLPPGGADTPRSLWEFLHSLSHRANPPGAVFNYNDADTEVLARVLERVSGLPLATLLSEQIWCHIGAQQDASICVDGEGVAVASAGISTSLRDLARFARWLLAEQCSEALPGQDPLPLSYWRQLWLLDGAPAMLGNNGQSVILLPGADLLAVKLSAIPNHQPAVISREHNRAHQAARAIARYLLNATTATQLGY